MGNIFKRQKPFIPASGAIGVCGVAANSGTTHLCIALANFLCSKFCSNTAYIELNGSHEICALAGRQDPAKAFAHQQIIYYPNATLTQLPKILSKRYKYYVLDFGQPNSHTMQAFLRCDIRLVIGHTALWKQPQFTKFVQETFYNTLAKEDTMYLGNFMEHKSDLELLSDKCKCNIPIVSVPFLPNPFRITSKDFIFFEKILGGN